MKKGYSGFGSHITTQKFKNILPFDPEVPRLVPMRNNEWVTTIKSIQAMKYCLVIRRNELRMLLQHALKPLFKVKETKHK